MITEFYFTDEACYLLHPCDIYFNHFCCSLHELVIFYNDIIHPFTKTVLTVRLG